VFRRDSILPPLNIDYEAYGVDEIADDAEEDAGSLEVIPLRYPFYDEQIDNCRNEVQPLTLSVNDTQDLKDAYYWNVLQIARDIYQGDSIVVVSLR
jgi:hypothetical protein